MELSQHDRGRLFDLFGGNEPAIRQIEFAVSHYPLARQHARDRWKKPAEIKKEADVLHQALRTLATAASTNSEAWQSFKWAAIDQGLIREFQALQGAVGNGAGEPGEALVFAAQESAECLKPKKGSPGIPDKEARLSFMLNIVNAARLAGIAVTRADSTFREIAEIAYRSANVTADPEHDIRDFLKAQAETIG